ncbi:MAG: hypothetical protein IJ106_08165 [Parasporobacterium sp.]|nr:hypothetical protein [Parasporobacterium sp.]
MTFPNGYHGVKKVFTAEILNLIASALMILAGVAGIVALGKAVADSADSATTALAGTGLFTIIAGILVIIAFIMRLVGLHQAGKEDDSFRTAFLIAIFALILAVVSAVLSGIFGENSAIDDIVTLVRNISNIVVIFLVIIGIQTFAVKLNHEKLISRGNTIAWIIICPNILAAIASLIIVFFGANSTTTSIAGITTIVSGILSIIGSILFLVYLGSGKKMLKNN